MPADSHIVATAAAYERYAEAYTHHRSDRSAIRPLIERFVSLLPGGALVLDVGCGPGVDTGSLALRGVKTVGLDIAAAMLEMASPHTGGRVVQADQRRLPFANATFDGVWANACLLHLSKHEVGGALAEVVRVVRPGGLVLTSMQIGVADSMEAPSQAASGVRASRYFARYEVDEWLSLLRNAGLEPLPAIESQDELTASKFWLSVFSRRP